MIGVKIIYIALEKNGKTKLLEKRKKSYELRVMSYEF